VVKRAVDAAALGLSALSGVLRLKLLKTSSGIVAVSARSGLLLRMLGMSVYLALGSLSKAASACASLFCLM
jgi:hypothetical protein